MLQDQGIALNGVILISSVLNFSALWGKRSDDLPYWLFVPTYAAVAAYHHKISPEPADLRVFLQSARKFAAGPYEQALEKAMRFRPPSATRSLSSCTRSPVCRWNI